MKPKRSVPWWEYHSPGNARTAAVEIEGLRQRLRPGVLRELSKRGRVHVGGHLELKAARDTVQAKLRRFDPAQHPQLQGVSQYLDLLERTCLRIRLRCETQMGAVRVCVQESRLRDARRLLDEIQDLVLNTDVMPRNFRVLFQERATQVAGRLRELHRDEVACERRLDISIDAARHDSPEPPNLIEVLEGIARVEGCLGHPDERSRKGLIARVTRDVSRHLVALFDGITRETPPHRLMQRLMRFCMLAEAVPSVRWKQIVTVDPCIVSLTLAVFEIASRIGRSGEFDSFRARVAYFEDVAEALQNARPLIATLPDGECHPVERLSNALVALYRGPEKRSRAQRHQAVRILNRLEDVRQLPGCLERKKAPIRPLTPALLPVEVVSKPLKRAARWVWGWLLRWLAPFRRFGAPQRRVGPRTR